MSDDYGNLVSAAADYGPALYSGYSAYKRNESFIRGATNATQGALLGADAAGFVTGSGRSLGAMAARSAVGGAVRGAVLRTAGATAARIGLTAAASTATSAAAGAAAGVGAGAAAGATAGSVVPVVGTAIGALVGTAAALTIPHIPGVGDAVNKIPVVGGILSPKAKKQKQIVGARGDTTKSSSNFLAQSSGEHTVSGAQSVMQNRAEYESGRGFRR